MFYLIEERDGETTIVYENESRQDVIDYALDEAEGNGYIPSVESREELEHRLKYDDHPSYTDGDVAIKIVEKA